MKTNLFGEIAITPATNLNTDMGIAGITAYGGFYVTMIAAENLSLGNIVYQSQSGTADRATRTPSDSDMPIGICAESVSSGESVRVVFAGKAYVKAKSGVTLTQGYVAFVANGATGEADNANAVPVAATHFREIGHVLESGSSGGLALCILHFN